LVIPRRPYFSFTIADLEKIFERSRGDEAVLADLLSELRQRSTDRAARLRVKVSETISATKRQAPSATSATLETGGPDRPGAAAILGATPQASGLLSTEDRHQLPPIRDRTEDILSAWIALEVLSPQTYRKPSDMADGDERRIARLEKTRQLPWAVAYPNASKNLICID
jgi:hypothetical protein